VHLRSHQLALELPATFKGRLVTPDAGAYEQMRMLFSGAIDARPAAIARPLDAADVGDVIRAARDSGVELAVRSGGHSGAGHSTVEGGLVLDLRDIRALEIDADARTAWAGTGLTAGEYSTLAAAHGLATGFGDTGSVGIGGLTLGGGIGYLTRTFGLTIDSLLAAEMVTADGQILHVDETSDPDLFWAIRGGGGNFGVATRFKFRLHPVDRVLGGMLLLPATADVIASFVEAAEAAPDELTTIANVMPAPPMPFVPAEHHGKIVLMGLMCYAGAPEAGERVLAPFRKLATPLADMVRPISYPEMFPPEDPSYRPKAIGHAMFGRSVDREMARTILDRLQANDAPVRVVQVRVLGGAMARVPVDATAFAHRNSRIMSVVASFYEGDEDRARRAAWVKDLAGAIDQGEPGAYANFLGNEGPERVRAAYPGATWDRLAAIKARCDPENVFRLNQNIPPARVARS
jgi:FAD/FMN-containing dehydrogenase